jgi:hypothetical protein
MYNAQLYIALSLKYFIVLLMLFVFTHVSIICIFLLPKRMNGIYFHIWFKVAVSMTLQIFIVYCIHLLLLLLRAIIIITTYRLSL